MACAQKLQPFASTLPFSEVLVKYRVSEAYAERLLHPSARPVWSDSRPNADACAPGRKPVVRPELHAMSKDSRASEDGMTNVQNKSSVQPQACCSLGTRSARSSCAARVLDERGPVCLRACRLPQSRQTSHPRSSAARSQAGNHIPCRHPPLVGTRTIGQPALATGEVSGVVVLDVDGDHGGFDSLFNSSDTTLDCRPPSGYAPDQASTSTSCTHVFT